MKIKISALDKLFSNYVRWIRDRGECQRCHVKYITPSSSLHCSHFHGRRKKSARFDLDNVAAMCHGCHAWLTANPAAHVNFFMDRLGKLRYDCLTIRANSPGRPDYEAIRIWLKHEMKNANINF